jgi:subtilisin family serine protease
MTRLLAALLLALAGCFVQAAAAQQPPAAAEAAEGSKILVMLKMPAGHFRPGARYSGRYDDKAAQQARRRVAGRIARENGLELLDGWPMPLVGVDCFVMRLQPGQAVDSVIERVSHYREVAWSQPLQDYHTLASGRATDPLYPTQPAASEWHLANLHQLATGKGVTIAIIDSKVETTHPDLAGQVTVSQDFLSARGSPPEDHGTGIAGVIGAKPDNGIGIVGVAPGARLMALRACSETRGGGSTCDTLSLAKALQFALERGADIINMSLSGPPDRLLSTLINLGLSRRVSVVAAYDPRRASGGFPASVPGVIAVADEALPSVPEPVFRAPGKDIPTTQPGGRWYLVNGSSFAAAHVTGLLALLREERRTNTRLGPIARAPTGVVDACATLVTITRSCNCACAIGLAAAHRRN